MAVCVRGGMCVMGQIVVLIVGVACFAIVFAINSSVHSYLVVRYADGDKVSQVHAQLKPQP